MAAPNREIELKFLLDETAVAAVLASLPPGETAVKDLVAVYYDTEDRWLGRHGFGMRVRRTGATCVQTLKSALGDDGGRDEWDWPVPTDAPEPALLAETPAALPAGATLRPMFTVRSRRTIRLLHEDGSEIELVIDDAEITAGGRTEAFLELEIELKSGDVAALQSLAERLGRVATLRPSNVTKAERGFTLLGR
ncbi:MAG: CYTH domain-containing protein [Pseudomonadota bacterium]